MSLTHPSYSLPHCISSVLTRAVVVATEVFKDVTPHSFEVVGRSYLVRFQHLHDYTMIVDYFVFFFSV